MKKILTAVLCAGLALFMTACGGSKDEGKSVLENAGAIPAPTEGQTESATLPEVPEGAIVDESGSFVYTGPLRQGGDDENGYIKVPLGYVPFQEEGVSGLTQYSDVTGTNVITLDYYEGIDYTVAATNLRYYMEEDETIEGLTGASVMVNGYQSLQLYCHFTDDNKFLVTWLIQDPADPASCYYLAIEFVSEDSDIMACSSTFQTVEDYAASASE